MITDFNGKTFLFTVQMEGSRSTAQSFWNYGRGALDFIPTFGAYQLATRYIYLQSGLYPPGTASFISIVHICVFHIFKVGDPSTRCLGFKYPHTLNQTLVLENI